jgi:hypothetical protein
MIFPMIDLSSSMHGSPMINAITLGFFTSFLFATSDVDVSPFTNKFLSFNTTPELGNINSNISLYNNIRILHSEGWVNRWGGSTNIHKAFELILNIAVNNNLTDSQMPKILAIFSDMQFDQYNSNWTHTTYVAMEKQYVDRGYTLPHIIFWNLRSNTLGYQVPYDKSNVTLLSGFSTRLLDLFLTSPFEDFKLELSLHNIHNVQNDKSTLTILNKILTHNMFTLYNDEINNLFS